VDSITKDDIVKVHYIIWHCTYLLTYCKSGLFNGSIINFNSDLFTYAVARTVFASRATLVAHGNLSSTPRLDHLLADISLK
jgi:hypothetical protein